MSDYRYYEDDKIVEITDLEIDKLYSDDMSPAVRSITPSSSDKKYDVYASDEYLVILEDGIDYWMPVVVSEYTDIEVVDATDINIYTDYSVADWVVDNPVYFIDSIKVGPVSFDQIIHKGDRVFEMRAYSPDEGTYQVILSFD